MKKLFSNLFIVSSILFFSGCGGGTTTNSSTSEPSVTTKQKVATQDVTNSIPVATFGEFTINKDVRYDGQLTATDADGDSLKYVIATQPQHGTVVIHDSGCFTYTPDSGYQGDDTFSYHASDDLSSCAVQTVTVNVCEPTVLVPNAPTNLEVKALSTTQLELIWSDNSSNEEGFVIYRDGILVASTSSNVTKKVICCGLQSGTTYTLEVRAKNQAGVSSSSIATGTTKDVTTVPNAPTDLKIISKNDTTVRLSWKDNTNTESSYELYQNGIWIKSISTGCNTILVCELDPCQEYTFEIRAKNKIGESTGSSVTTKTDGCINHIPIANAGANRVIDTDTIITLEGNGSTDPDGDSLTYAWSIVEKPADSVVVISDVNVSNPTFTADTAGKYVLQLVVNDGMMDSLASTVEIQQNPIIGLGSVSGILRDALTSNGIPNVTLNFREGEDVKVGAVFKTIVSDANGSYLTSDLPEGKYTVEAVVDNYITGYFTVESIADLTNGNQNHALSPILNDGETRIILTWSADPHDLDSHLIGPDGNGSKFHVYYQNKSDSNSSLDLDDTTSFGPETITITQQHAGEYTYYVRNYSNNTEDELTNSQAKIDVYRGDSLVATFNVPEGQGYYWTVFTLNGNQITEINTIGEEPQ